MDEPRFERGLVHVITGDGPGKTTSAIGKGVRAAGYGYNVCMIQFMKSGKVLGEKTPQDLGEISFLKNARNFSIVSFGREGFVNKEYVTLAKKGIDKLKMALIKKGIAMSETARLVEQTEKDISLAEKALEYAESAVNEGKCDVVILDEINVALDYGLVDKQRIINLIKNKPSHIELILTGRDAPPEVINLAEYVVIISEVKHPFRSFKLAGRRGVEF